MEDTMEVVDLNCSSFRSYQKVTKEAENDQEFRRKTLRRTVTIIVSSVLLVGIAIAIGVIFAVNRRGGGDQPPPQGRALDLVALACSVTPHPESCYKSISGMLGGIQVKDPKEIFKVSLDVATAELSRFSRLSRMLAIGANNTRVRRALQTCTQLIDDSIDRINDSASLVDPMHGLSNLSRSSINDITTWVSAALTNLETCLDGFEGTNSVFRAMVESILVKAREFIGDSLAIAVRVLGTLHELGVPLHRKLLTAVGPESSPGWLGPGSPRRRLFQEALHMVPDATVSKDGSGQFGTIGAAIAAAPARSPRLFVIYVKGGRYVEKVVVGKDKWNVVMIGDGADKTIITYNSSFSDGIPTFETSTFAVEGRGFMARDIGFVNTAGPRGGPAVAARSNSDRSIFYRCSFSGYENTLYVLSLRQFFRDCEIRGTVDFIFGNAAVVFQNCTIRPMQPLRGQTNTIVAQGRSDQYQNTGTSLQNCHISQMGRVRARTYLGRPSKAYSTAVVMKSEIGPVVSPEGWWAGAQQGEPPPTVFFGEYENVGPGSVTTSRVRWAGYRPKLSEADTQRFLLGPLVGGETWIPQKGVEYSGGL